MRPLRPALLTGLVLIAAMVLHAQPRAMRPPPGTPVVPAGPSGAPTPGASASPAPDASPTRLQVEFFQVDCLVEKLRSIDIQKLQQGNPSADELVKRLGEIGEASMPVRFSNVIDLGIESNLTQGTRLPVVQGVNFDPRGKVTPSISYNDISAMIHAQGHWDELRAPVRFTIDFSGISKTGLEISKGIEFLAFPHLRLDQQITLEHGKPVLILGNTQATIVPPTTNPADAPAPPARCAATLVRITAWKLGAEAKE